MTGHVSLVGAGPGDPALLTRKAVARLRAADLVLYDALVDPCALRFARRAQKFFVGKRCGRHAMRQEAINALMIRAARRGRRVVRLKGGDPFVFGRGGEEALALRDAGIAFDIVPGVSSAFAAPALAGIPATHRGASSALLVVNGHDETNLNVKPGRMTVVVLMGIGRAAAIARRFMDCGWSADTPSAIVFDASTSRQQAWRGSLEQLATDERALASDGPGTIVIGDVAAINVFE